MYCIKAVVCQLYEMLYPCICNVVISCWKFGAYGIVICRGGTDMCFVPGFGWKLLDLEQYRISGLTTPKVHLAGCNFIWYLRRFLKVTCRSLMTESAS